jgi:hypothetical protein
MGGQSGFDERRIDFRIANLDYDDLITLQDMLARNAEELAEEGLLEDADDLDEAAGIVRMYVDRYCVGGR